MPKTSTTAQHTSGATAPAASAAKTARNTAARKAPVRKAAAKPVKADKPTSAPKAPKVLAPAPAAAEAAAKPARPKEKLVRDSFTMPRSDFALVQQLKDRAMGFRHAAKKSELLRAGLHALARLDTPTLKALLTELPALKSGRPRKGG